jgi:pyridoxal phosphate enzyme (YggS family)
LTRAEEIGAGLSSVRRRIADAERAAGRPAGSVRLVAISKKMPAADVQLALGAGQLDFGENYGQELRDKRAAVAGARWHFVGPLQTNKVKYVAGQVALIHSVDSIPLLDAIDARGVRQPCLVQVNVAGEHQKRGVAVADLPPLLDRFAALANVRCEGLMVIPPFADDPEASRATFAALRALRDQNAATTRLHVDLRDLSMGMSHDLEVAIAEGATLVRIGTAIFGERPKSG